MHVYEFGDEVEVSLPHDVSGWYVPAGATYKGWVHYVNGDLLDVEDEDGNIEPMPVEWCRPHTEAQPASLPSGRSCRSAMVADRAIKSKPDLDKMC